jgi:hypothetical protein
MNFFILVLAGAKFRVCDLILHFSHTELESARGYLALVVERGNFGLKWLAAESGEAYDARQMVGKVTAERLTAF